MLISHVEARLVRVPVARPTRMATRVLGQRDYVLVTIRAGDAEGVGYCYAGTSGGTVVREAIASDLAAVLVGAGVVHPTRQGPRRPGGYRSGRCTHGRGIG